MCLRVVMIAVVHERYCFVGSWFLLVCWLLGAFIRFVGTGRCLFLVLRWTRVFCFGGECVFVGMVYQAVWLWLGFVVLLCWGLRFVFMSGLW